jgi:NAD(P)-dependent dehydrogenase (short-subunit alcohol dehydrogenase family)
MGPYVATKHAVVALTESLYLDLQLAGNGVGASVLCPEWVQTQIHQSERNRPEGVGEMTMPGADGPTIGLGDMLEGLIASGLDPAVVADKVVEAITGGRFWIFTHDTSLAAAKRRWQAIESDATPVMWAQS